MKKNILFILALLAVTGVHAQTIVWWRLDQTEPPIMAQEGGPGLKWWVETSGPYVASSEVPPAGLYAGSVGSPLNSFNAGDSYGDQVRGLISEPGGEFYNAADGLTVEGFFKTHAVKPILEKQTIVSCGEGFADIAWLVRLVDGKPSFALFQGTGADPVIAAEIEDDVRDERWYYFAARVTPGAPGKISLLVKAEGEAAQTAELDLPPGLSVRPNRKPLIIGRSSLFIDPKPEYRGTWDTLAGMIADIRISSGALPDSELLGKVVK